MWYNVSVRALRNDRKEVTDLMNDNRNNPFAPMSKPTHCSVCGKPLTYKGRGSYICESCNNVEYDDFGRIDQYLEEHGPSSAPVLSRALNIPVSEIHGLVAQGRLEPLPTGHKTLDSTIYDTVMAIEETKRTGTYINGPGKLDEDRMRYLSRKGKPSDKG